LNRNNLIEYGGMAAHHTTTSAANGYAESVCVRRSRIRLRREWKSDRRASVPGRLLRFKRRAADDCLSTWQALYRCARRTGDPPASPYLTSVSRQGLGNQQHFANHVGPMASTPRGSF
jgi:hypothetical protein